MPIKDETPLQKTKRLRKEREEAAAKKEFDTALFEKKEMKRKAAIILPYLDNLEESIREKNLMSFWTFPDRSGFKKN